MAISRRTLLKNLAILGMAGSCGFLFSKNAMAGQMNFEAYKGKILIAYFSRTGENYGVGNISKGNTEIVAECIRQNVGGELFHIEPAVQYPQNYDECVNLAKKEQKEKARPSLAKTLDSIQNYELIFLGFPNWWGDMPMPVYTFVEQFDFTGKIIIPFCTHEGSGLGSIPQKIERACKGAAVLKGIAVRGSAAQNSQKTVQDTVNKWLADL